jgi:hypothetical protein
MTELYIKLKDGGKPFPMRVGDEVGKRENQFGSKEILYKVTYLDEERTLVASEALDRQLSALPPDADVVISLTKEGNKSRWSVIRQDAYDETYVKQIKKESSQMQSDYNTQRNKEAEGKVRHGFAVECYKMEKPLNKATTEEINRWVQYVLTGEASEGKPKEDLPF